MKRRGDCVFPGFPDELSFPPPAALLIGVCAGRSHKGGSPYVPRRHCPPTCRASRGRRHFRHIHPWWCTLTRPLHPQPLLTASFFFSHTGFQLALYVVQTVVGQSFCYVHRSPLMYERPEAFLPERWLGPNAKACDTALSAFSKGPRACFGVNLAYAELHLGIANVFRRFDLGLDDAR